MRFSVHTAAQLSQLSFQSGSVMGDTLAVRASDDDGLTFSPFTSLTVTQTQPDSGPTVTASDHAARRMARALRDRACSATAIKFNDAATNYQFYDATPDLTSGHFVLNGLAQAAQTFIDLSAAQLPQLSFQSGAGLVTLAVRASDDNGDRLRWLGSFASDMIVRIQRGMSASPPKADAAQ